MLLRTLRSNHLHSSPKHHQGPVSLHLLLLLSPLISHQRRISSLAAQETAANAKPRSLSSIFLKPSSPPKNLYRKERKGVTNSSSLDFQPENGAKPGSLSSIFSKPSGVSMVRRPSNPEYFARKEKKEGALYDRSRYPPLEEKDFPEELSPEAMELVSRLQEDGYLKEANFYQEGQLEPHEIPPNQYSRHFLKSAAEEFGQDHQVIAKWLSGGDLKRVALFGCPSVERKTVFAAKRLRSFFRIQEDIICRACKLKYSCKFMNKKPLAQDRVILSDVMRLVTLFSLDSIPLQLSIPNDLKISINKLLKEVIKLSNGWHRQSMVY